MKVIIDTNAWISFLINKTEMEFVDRLLHSTFSVITSTQAFDEIKRIGLTKKFRPYFSETRLAELLQALSAMGYLVEHVPSVVLFQDPKDEFLLDLCHISNADFLVTGDKALLSLAKYHHTKIITLREFKKCFCKIKPMAEIELTYEQVVDMMRQLPLEIKVKLLEEFSQEIAKDESKRK